MVKKEMKAGKAIRIQPLKSSIEKKPNKNDDLNKILIENFVGLQKAMTNLAVRFDTLSDNISKLLQLFEISAKSFVEKNPVVDEQKDKEFLDRLNALLDQNKTIAKGLTLIEEKIRERVYGQPNQQQMQQQPQQPMQQRFQPSQYQQSSNVTNPFEARKIKPLPA